MAELPTGTVTFLFTDVESSTQLWEQHRDAMRQALVRHDALVEKTVVEHFGHLVRPRGEGDSRFAVFARATDAVAAAAALQQALYAEPWPTPTPLRVRMALHTGEADLREGDYYGSAVNRCARLRAVAHGGQTLVSLATEQLVRGQTGGDVMLRDLGEHRLRDLQHPERIFALIANGLSADFPPLKTPDARPNNLPIQRDPLIGRDQEVADVTRLLRSPQIGLVTLTGPGGTGKTRLSFQVAAELLDDLPDGAWFVDLAPIAEPALVASTIAQALGLKEASGRPILESLKIYLRDRRLLLILDNFEQILPAAEALSDLLAAAPHLKLLVTSRELLHLYGEHEYAVPPLALPDLRHLPGLAHLSQNAAVALFIQRARAAKTGFQVTDETVPAVAELCVRLDGLPLAIELAAARIKLFTPQALLARFTQGGPDRLKLLTGGARDRSTRQQTLRGAIDWSFNLLEPEMQRLFTRLAVFVGGCSVEAAEAVCNAKGDLELDVLNGLGSLVDKSLLRAAEGLDGEPRFSMFETIREYAVERLAGAGEGPATSDRHLAFFLEYADDAAARPRPGERLGFDQDNLRAALTWALGGRNVAAGMQLLHASAAFWEYHEQFTEWNGWLERALARQDPVPAAIRATMFYWAGYVAFVLGGFDMVVIARLEESRALFQQVGDRRGEANVLIWLGHVTRNRGDYVASVTALEQALELYEALGDAVERANVSGSLGATAIFQGDYSRARMLQEQALAENRELGNEPGVAAAFHNLGEVALLQGDYEHAARWCTESLALFRRRKEGVMVGWTLHNFGYVAAHQGDIAQARVSFRESLELFRDRAAMDGLAVSLAGMAQVAVSQDQPKRAAVLLGAAESMAANIGGLFFPVYRVEQHRTMTMVKALVDPETFAAAWSEGRTMTLEQAIAYALEDLHA